MAKKGLRIGNLENKAPWYSTPLDKLHFEWSPEEKLEIERYSEKILKNIAEEDMTPMERNIASHEGKSRDRSLLDVWLMHDYNFKSLDSHAEALKPMDVYHHPKFMVKAALVAVARHHLDFPYLHPISYTEEFWGGNGKLTEHAQPQFVGEFPIKSMEDLEGLEVPDPYKHGMFPGYLWACRELRRMFDQYGLSKVMPMEIAFTGSPLGTAMFFMTGMARFAVALRKEPEFAKACVALTTEWTIRFGKAVWEVAHPEIMELCALTGAVSPKGNEWIADYWAKIGHALGAHTYCTYGYALQKTVDFIPVMFERGALAVKGSFCGGLCDIQIPFKQAIDLHRERNLFICAPIKDTTLLDGPASAIEAELKERWEYANGYPKFTMGIGGLDYWTPPSHIDAMVNGIKIIGKEKK